MSGQISRRIRVSGIVQGVGFRPFVWRLANEIGLTGWVRNDSEGVEIEAVGTPVQIGEMLERLRQEAPPLARVDSIATGDETPRRKGRSFEIVGSAGGRAATMIGQDTAVCSDCLAEMFNPSGRRWRYAFTNCTHCGPRYTISLGIPYDRARTSLKPFPLCGECQREYKRPDDRRFHAEGNCCPKCGPQLMLTRTDGQVIGGDPVHNAVELLRQGKILAIKGLGGFHLACDARNAEAVVTLRQRKQRDEKPFVVMFANALSTAPYVQTAIGEPGLLTLPERPAVLLKKHRNCDAALPGISPGLNTLAVMLPYTPLQYLLFHEAAGRPAGSSWLTAPQQLALVMTSANPGGEPLVIGNDEARQRLGSIADAFLMHDREIVTRCDDSVVRASPGGMQFLRRARGYTPRAIKLPHAGPPVLAVGSWYKNTVCVTRGDEAFVSQHVGDLDNAATCAFLEDSVAHLLELLEVDPAIVAHDLHPDFHSSRFAADFAARRGLPLLGVQHHHAHAAAVLAEHGIVKPTLALALDGVGMGNDGAAWGGELLRVSGHQFERLGSLTPLALPGGDRAAREPWRMAAAVLHRLGRGDEIARRFADQPGAATIAKMLAGDINCPQVFSLGRIFDAVAGLLGLRRTVSYEGQAAMELESLAERYGTCLPADHGWKIRDGQLDLLPLFAALADDPDPAHGAAVFHATLIAALTEWVHALAPKGGVIVGSGGCFLNRILSRGLHLRFGECGLKLLEAQKLPPNDGGISLGQAWVALQYLQAES